MKTFFVGIDVYIFDMRNPDFFSACEQKSADHPFHPPSVISASEIHLLKSIISIFASCDFQYAG